MQTTKKRSAESSAENAGHNLRVRRAIVNFRKVVTSAKRHLMVKDGQGAGSPSAAHLLALWHVQSSPGLTVLQLTEKLSMHQSTTSNLVEKLETAGYLRRQRDAADKRVVRLFVSPMGAKIMKQAPDSMSGKLPEVFRRLSRQELAALELALQSLSRELGITPDAPKRRRGMVNSIQL